ncbi:MAG: NAD(P)/FAD-dependent oxidoreductase [Hyphomicrobiaceae bacterium]
MVIAAGLPPRRVAIIGAGPAGLMAAERLAVHGISVDVYEQKPTPARKLLMAGRGGLNLTNAEPLDIMLARYTPRHRLLDMALRNFTPNDLRGFAGRLGQDTFVGSSGRVFPRAMKASPLVRAWLGRLADLGVAIHTNHRLTGFHATTRRPLVADLSSVSGPVEIDADAVLLTAGGASWPRLGSDGAWAEMLAAAGIAIEPLVASNCAVHIPWSDHFRMRHAGAPLKRIALTAGGIRHRGEPVVTARGLEGGPVYAAGPAIRDLLSKPELKAELQIDLRPDLDHATLERLLSRPRSKQSTATWLRKSAGLSPVAMALLREPGNVPIPLAPAALAARIKALHLGITGLAGLDRAISTAGGIRLDELDDNMMLAAWPGLFAAGEMLDWDAPTGGYLLQATFATAVAAADGIARWLSLRAEQAGDPSRPPAG